MTADDTGAEALSEDDVRAKRMEFRDIPAGSPWIGLALSGGGVRSATFCLGILRGLAKNGALKRFDYLSTVSGGGYIGAAWGRLFQGPPTAAQAAAVEAGVANDNSLFIWWLRQNGRYLTPAGARDLFKAWTGQFRAFVATHIEIALLALLVGVVVASAHMLYVQLVPPTGGWPIFGSAWFYAIPPLLAAAATLMCAYWLLGRAVIAGVFVASLTGVGAYIAYSNAASHPAWSLHLSAQVFAYTCLIPPLGFAIALTATLISKDPAGHRVRLNTALAWTLGLVIGVIFLGLLDMASWSIRYWVLEGNSGSQGVGVLTGAGLSTVLLAVLRAILPALSPRGKDKSTRSSIPWLLVAQVASYVLFTLVILFWTSLVQLAVFLQSDDGFPHWLQHDAARAACIVVPILIYMIITGHSLTFLNQSSLHLFYRSRLARTYVATGNDTGKNPRFQVKILLPRTTTTGGTNPLTATQVVRKATEILPNDDVDLLAYQPHMHGGPIHLINCCINQSIDDRTGTFNADRKGVALTISTFGPEIGTGTACASRNVLARTSLAEWIAISGAAIGSGMGTYTRSALSALLFVSGLRLGYWQKNLCKPGAGFVPFVKYSAMLRECLGMFPGLGSRKWYLSDGGHFDNTGVYALLKRKLDLIVLADCGADPDYTFGDVENLVRKARIDYGYDIEFVKPRWLQTKKHPLAAFVATPTTMSNQPGNEFLLLARIRYAQDQYGVLLIIKPRVPTDFDLDTTAYAERRPPFPQQSTAQQFFSEEQWESYCHLGTKLGAFLDQTTLAALPALMPDADVTTLKTGALAPRRCKPPKRPTAGTVGASLGVGAFITALIAVWQAWGAQESEAAKLRKEVAAESTRVVDKVRTIRDELKQGLVNADHVVDDVDDLVKLSSSTSLEGGSRDAMAYLETMVTNRCGSNPASLAGNCDDILAKLKNAQQLPEGTWVKVMNRYRGWYNTSEAPPPPPPGHSPTGNAANGTTVASGHAVSANVPERVTHGAEQAATLSAAPSVSITTPDDIKAACGGTDDPTTVYIQIYDESSREDATLYASALKMFGMRVPGIENVTATAMRRGTRPPFKWDRPTILYSAIDGGTCATSLAQWAKSVRGLGPSAQAVPLSQGRGKAGTVELWLPAPQ